MKKIALLISITILLVSCVKEDLDDCGINVFFRYDYNMLSADAFASQADDAKLYVFDQNGLLVSQHDYTVPETGAPLTIDRLPEGRYRFVAWGKGNTLKQESADFVIPEMKVGTSRIEDLKYRLKNDTEVYREALNPFLVGTQQVDISEKDGGPVTISLRKVTKKIRVVLLPYVAGTGLDVNNYAFRVADPVGNSVVGADYSLLPSDPITYEPYYTATITPASGEIPAVGEIDRAAVAEIATSRLLEVNAPRLYVTDRSGSRLLADINLPWLFGLTEMESHREWSLQEYLDRQDEFVVMLFFQNDTWMNATIIINGWVVNNISFD